MKYIYSIISNIIIFLEIILKLLFYYFPILIFIFVENNIINNIINLLANSHAFQYSSLYNYIDEVLFNQGFKIFVWFLKDLLFFLFFSIIISWGLNCYKRNKFHIDIGKLIINQFKYIVQYIFTSVTFLFAITAAVYTLERFDKANLHYFKFMILITPLIFGLKFLQISYLIRLPERNSNNYYTWNSVFKSLNIYIKVWPSILNVICKLLK